MKSVNVYQTAIMLFIIIFANKILLLPSLLYRTASAESVFCYLIAFALEILLLTLFIFLKRKYSTSFSSLIKAKLGKISMVVFYVLLMIFFFCKCVLIYNVTYIFFKDLIYKNSGSFLFIICFLPITNYLAFSSFRVLGRTCQIFFPIILVVLIFCTVTSLVGVNDIPLFFTTSAGDVFLATIKHISSFGDFVFLFVFMDKIEFKAGDGKKLYFFALIAILFVLTLAVAFYFSYTYTSFMHPYAIFETMGKVKDYGGLGRIDSVAVVLVIILTYLQMAIYLKSFVCCFCEVFPKLNSTYALISFDLTFLAVVYLLIRNLEKTVLYAESVLPYFSLISFFLVPLCAIIFLVTKDKKEGK